MDYKNIREGVFLKRPNRFIAEVDLEGEVHQVHVPNTGRAKELFIPGRRVLLEGARPGSKRKTAYSLVHVEKEGKWVNIDSQMPNHLVAEWLAASPLLEGLGPVKDFKREVQLGKSRIDFQIRGEEGLGFMEVKGVTLEEDGRAYFPDAPTERGRRHLEELTQLAKEGIEAYVFFVVQLEKAFRFSPNWKTDPGFSQALVQAQEAGVHILVYNSRVDRGHIRLLKPLDYFLGPKLEIKETGDQEEEAVLAIYREAQEGLKEAGVDQWQKGYPNKESLDLDRKKNQSFVFLDQGEVLATAALCRGEEPSYRKIQGAWAHQEPYLTIHRIGLKRACWGKKQGRRLMETIIDYAMARGIFYLRVDTHKDNQRMRRLVEASGFSYAGLIQLEDGAYRLAYERKLIV
ncbi:MAG: DNA/RNA nuclease SfsA [Tissierellia bacterium]|nr:DNA/RNA nuclease SfsA [Tissierellia bacterium]